MRSKFDEQLGKLNNEMIDMGNLIISNITSAIRAMKNKDRELALQIMRKDAEVDSAQKRIESTCFNLLIQQQPVARDLRTVTAAMKMVTDMERIGDHAADISEITVHLGYTSHIEKYEHISRMAAETTMMLSRAIEAYVERDTVKAEEVIAHDDVVDNLFNDAKSDVIDLIRTSPEDGIEATDLLMIAKYFERIGDHATNIAEWVIYSLRTTEKM